MEEEHVANPPMKSSFIPQNLNQPLCIDFQPIDIPVYEAAPKKISSDGRDWLVSVGHRPRQGGKAASHKAWLFSKAFLQSSLDSFDEIGDHISVENQLNDMEELLTTTKCTEEQKAVHTTYKLTGEAKHCWQDKKVVLIAELGLEITITQNIFKHEFNQLFFPKVVQEAKAREFMDLIQRRMSVIEYATKFPDTIRHVPHP